MDEQSIAWGRMRAGPGDRKVCIDHLFLFAVVALHRHPDVRLALVLRVPESVVALKLPELGVRPCLQALLEVLKGIEADALERSHVVDPALLVVQILASRLLVHAHEVVVRDDRSRVLPEGQDVLVFHQLLWVI